MPDQLITKYADALDKLVAVPQPLRYITDPVTERVTGVDMDALSADIEAMRYTGRCYLCNHDFAVDLQGVMPGDGLRMCRWELGDACNKRRNALHSPKVTCKRCNGLGEVVVASHGDDATGYNDDFDECPKCKGSGKVAA